MGGTMCVREGTAYTTAQAPPPQTMPPHTSRISCLAALGMRCHAPPPLPSSSTSRYSDGTSLSSYSCPAAEVKRGNRGRRWWQHTTHALTRLGTRAASSLTLPSVHTHTHWHAPTRVTSLTSVPRGTRMMRSLPCLPFSPRPTASSPLCTEDEGGTQLLDKKGVDPSSPYGFPHSQPSARTSPPCSCRCSWSGPSQTGRPQ
jgi:hypothetical protein